MNTGAMARTGRTQVRRAANGSAAEAAARAGFTARGVIYLLVGVLALQIAFGDGKREADRSGALTEIAEKPFGAVLLWALGLGLVGMALWRLSEALFGAVGPEGHTAKKRLLAAARSLFYAFTAFSVLSFAAGSGSGGGSSDEQSRDVTAEVLRWPGGQWLVGVAGAAIVVTGVGIGARAVRRKYHDKMKLGQMGPRVRRLVDVTGIGGGAARGVVFAAAGAFAVRAAADYEPDKAKGLDDTLRSFADTPLGPWLLVLVAAGLVLFGVFSFAMARWRRV
ncbi:membrane protein [Streptomyces fumigatiscleroticus]|nr:membrane protein [Streptomyces fumigatiscleroticus]